MKTGRYSIRLPELSFRIIKLSIGIFIFSLLNFDSALAQSERKLIREGNELYKNKKYAEAEAYYKKSLGTNNKSIEGNYNLGNSLYKQGKFEDAEKQFQSIASDKNLSDEQKSMLYHNYGNSLLKDQKYQESINAYKNALKLNSKDNDTRYNLAYAQSKLLQQQQQQQQQNKDQNKDQKDKDKKNQQQKEQQNQDKKDQQQQEMNKQEQKQAQQKKEISKEDAEKILQALNNDEKNTQKKLTKKQAVKTNIEKEW